MNRKSIGILCIILSIVAGGSSLLLSKVLCINDHPYAQQILQRQYQVEIYIAKLLQQPSSHPFSDNEQQAYMYKYATDAYEIYFDTTITPKEKIKHLKSYRSYLHQAKFISDWGTIYNWLHAYLPSFLSLFVCFILLAIGLFLAFPILTKLTPNQPLSRKQIRAEKMRESIG